MEKLPERLQHLSKRVSSKTKRQRYVYVVKCGEFYKVGVADNYKHRIATLQAATPYPIEFVKAWQAKDAEFQERAIHGLLWRFHERGEWFKLPIEIVLAFGNTDLHPITALKKILG
jgi:hypothetical protein